MKMAYSESAGHGESEKSHHLPPPLLMKIPLQFFFTRKWPKSRSLTEEPPFQDPPPPSPGSRGLEPPPPSSRSDCPTAQMCEKAQHIMSSPTSHSPTTGICAVYIHEPWDMHNRGISSASATIRASTQTHAYRHALRPGNPSLLMYGSSGVSGFALRILSSSPYPMATLVFPTPSFLCWGSCSTITCLLIHLWVGEFHWGRPLPP